ncbi:MAG: site-2 protease family protein [Candidatus Aminicenantes bacterium]|nr:site-2 protease family protein [Candidatus Aminicenantes bacterium]
MAKDRPWLNGALFVLTLGSAYVVGLSWSASYLFVDRIAPDPALRAGGWMLRDPRVIGLSAAYAAALMAILLAHELGHYWTCRRNGLSATLPFFIPAPTLIGTLGAFIKIRTPISRKRVLFDVGIAGPLAGFALAVPALAAGLAWSKVVPSLPREESILFGEPLLLKLLSAFLVENPGPGHDLVLHPVAFAGWVGVLITALNLFPVGQLDGGHIAYAALGPKSRPLARFVLILFLILAAVFWAGWLIWFFLLLLLRVDHPRIADEEAPLGRGRTALAWAAFLIFVLSFIPAPVKAYNLLELIRMLGR